MSQTNNNGNGSKRDLSTATNETKSRSPIEQAEALRDSLKEAQDKTRELIRTLKAQKKTSKIVESTMASLRQLQSVDL